jgi:uncharacterized protein CbrC (UPF0167 family)
MEYKFKYFHDYQKWARFVEDDCDCPDQGRCLNGMYFGDPKVGISVCLLDLIDGRVKVDVPKHIIKTLEASIRNEFPEWDDIQMHRDVLSKVEELSRTPPVPWLQQNMWPISEGDFCEYLGEWTTEEFEIEGQEFSGQQWLWKMLPDRRKKYWDSESEVWNHLKSHLIIAFVFRSLKSKRYILIDQSY